MAVPAHHAKSFTRVPQRGIDNVARSIVIDAVMSSPYVPRMAAYLKVNVAIDHRMPLKLRRCST